MIDQLVLQIVDGIIDIQANRIRINLSSNQDLSLILSHEFVTYPYILNLS